MDLSERVESFAELGIILRNSLGKKPDKRADKLFEIADNHEKKNPWFTPANVRYAISIIAEKLTESNLGKWTTSYPAIKENYSPLTTGVIMAGNIPLAGFHDFLSVLISNNKLIGRLSSRDALLIPALAEILCSVNKGFRKKITFTESTIAGFDNIIASGSDNSSRYFEYYFGKYPSIIRKNRNSIAVLTGSEPESDLVKLGKDIFTYFGLGCRSVSKILLPHGYNPGTLLDCWNGYTYLANHSAYANNYDFNKAVFLVNREKFFDSGYLLMREDKKLSSPVSVLHYGFYENEEDLNSQIKQHKDKIQCIVSGASVAFGSSQEPDLWDYADGIDTLDFLLKKNLPGIS